MHRWIERIVVYCLDQEYVTESQAPWLRYTLEKRLYTAVVAIPFLLIGILISSFAAAISFYMSFSVLRSRTSGLHANNPQKCFYASIMAEAGFLGLVPRLMPDAVIAIMAVISAVYIFIFAPFKHPNLNLNEAEVKACAISTKIRVAVVGAACCVFYFFDLAPYAIGIAMGTVMAAVLLALAYIIQKGEF